LDDDFDTDNGYSGIVQYGLAIKNKNLSDNSTAEGFESDNNKTGIDGITPKTSCAFYNITQIGGFPCASNAAGSGVAPSALYYHDRGARIRRNSDMKLINSILMNNWRGVRFDNSIVSGSATAPVTVNFDEDSLIYRNNTIAGDFSTTWATGVGINYNNTTSLAYSDAGTRSRATTSGYGNDSVNTCSLLTDAWAANQDNADWRPNSAGDGSVLATNVSTPAVLNITFRNDATLFDSAQARPVAVTITNQGATPTVGPIIVRISKPSGFTGTYSTSATTSNLGTPITVRNSDFNFTESGAFITITSKPGVVLNGSNSTISIGLTQTRNNGTGKGTNQNISVDVIGGGDVTRLTTQATYSAN